MSTASTKPEWMDMYESSHVASLGSRSSSLAPRRADVAEGGVRIYRRVYDILDDVRQQADLNGGRGTLLFGQVGAGIGDGRS